MKKIQIDKLMERLIGLSALVILIGIFLEIYHKPNSILIMCIGISSNLIVSRLETIRLKKIIKELKPSSTI